MTFDQFISKYNGKAIDFDGAYGPQCMDLMHQYVYEVLGITDRSALAAPYAYLAYTNFNNISNHEKFDKIANTPTGVPQKGDIILWKQYQSGVTGVAGHVAVFKDGDVNAFNSLDQNYPTGSLTHTQNHSYSGVLGWLRVKSLPQGDEAVIIQVRAIIDSSINSSDKRAKIKAIV